MSPHQVQHRRLPTTSWSPRRLLALLAAAGVLLGSAAVGSILMLIPVGTSRHPAEASHSRSAPPSAGNLSFTASLEDALAAAPLPTASMRDAEPAALATGAPPPLDLPRSTGSGPDGVATGFAHTSDGALAQLAAIDQAAIESGSVAGARAIVTGWAVPGAPGAHRWSQVKDVARLLTGLQLSDAGSPRLAVVWTPAMGLVKGRVGSDFTVVCVDAVLTVTYQRTARIAVADCQRMTWSTDRWLLAAGTPPAPAPAVWPGTAKSFAVGYRELGHD